MRKAAILAAALLALAGCGQLFPGGDTGGNESAGNAATGNVAAGEQARADAPTDAGITRSRSLLGLTGGGSEGLADKEPTAIQAGAQAVPAAMLYGSWSDDGNCKQGIEFLPDGSFNSWNGEGGRWSLEGDVLTLTGAGGRYQLRITSIDAGRVTTQNPDGTTGQSTRC